VAELDRARHPELGEPAHILGSQALGMLDPVAQTQRRPRVACRLERVERLAIRPVADRVHSDRPAEASALPDDLCELLPARDGHSRAVQHPGRLRPERPVHERFQVPDAEEFVADARVDAERLELRQSLVRHRLPDPQRQPLTLGDALEDAGSAEPPVLVVDGDNAAARSDA
jgi:hypothetical protein